MQAFKEVLAELDEVVSKITSGERSRNKFTVMLDEQLSSINSSLAVLEQVDVKLGHMITGFMTKLKLCNDDLAAEQFQKSEIEAKRQELASEIEMMRTSAEIASAQTEEERRRLIDEHQREKEAMLDEANTKLGDLGDENDALEAEKKRLQAELQLERENIERIKYEANAEYQKLGEDLTTQISNKDSMIALQGALNEELQADLQRSREKTMRITEKLEETNLDLQKVQADKTLLTAQKVTNEEQIQKLNEFSAMSQEELEAFKVKNKQDLTSAKDQMETLDKKIKELESDLDEKNKTLTEGVAAIRRVITMLQQFVTDDDSADTSITSKNEEIRDKVKKQMEVIRKIEDKLDKSGLGETTEEFIENPMRSMTEVEVPEEVATTPAQQPSLEQFKKTNPLAARTSTRQNKGERKVTKVTQLGDIGVDPNAKKGGTRKRRRSKRTRRCSTKRKRNQKKRKVTRRKRRKQRGGYTYKTSV